MRASAIIAFAISLGFTSVAHRALACSVCGCDPAAGTLGVDRPSFGDARFALEDRYLYKESGTGVDAESERENRLVARAQYSPWAPLVLQVEVPYFIFKNHLNAAGVLDDQASGLGDVSVGARWEPLRDGLAARHVLALTTAVKLPTGANDRHLPGEQPDEHIQLGTGSWDGLFGASYLFGARPWTLFANLSARVNGTNSRGFHYGNAIFASAGARRAFLESGRLIASLEAQVRKAGMDRAGDGSLDPNSGGAVGYATGSVAVGLTTNLLFRVLAQVPVVTALNGVQSEHPVLYAALAYDVGL
jgi:hypothetical protein